MIERVEEQPSAEIATPGAALEVVRAHAWIAVWWAVGRAVVLATALVVDAVGPRGYVGHDERTHAFGLLASWDGHWYKRVAETGYLLLPGRQSDPAFFPLYSIFLRAGHALGLSYEATGLLVSNLTLLMALYAFHAMTRELMGEPLARRATVYVAVFPAGYVFSMIYPESFVLATICFAGLAGLREHWGRASVWAAAGALARPEAAFVALPLLALAWQGRRRRTPLENGVALGAAAAPLAALASYPLYLAYALHNPFAWSEAQSGWGRRFSPIGIVDAARDLPTTFSQNAWVARDLAALVGYLLLLALARRAGAPLAWQLAALAVVVLPPFSGSFHSIARFGLLAPAVFWGLAWLGRRRPIDQTIRIVSLALLVAATATIPFFYP